jgi:hypothetical protein
MLVGVDPNQHPKVRSQTDWALKGDIRISGRIVPIGVIL